MTSEQQAAYINSQVTCAMVEAMGMRAENMQRQQRGESMAYTYEHFASILTKYGVHRNAVLTIFES